MTIAFEGEDKPEAPLQLVNVYLPSESATKEGLTVANAELPASYQPEPPPVP